MDKTKVEQKQMFLDGTLPSFLGEVQEKTQPASQMKHFHLC